MQTSTSATARANASSLPRRIVAASWKPALFAVLMWAAAAAGAIPVPGSPTPITLQTFVVMMAGLMLPWRQAVAAVAAYLAAGAAGLPVFAGGMSTLALVGPDAGFLLGFLPGVAAIALLRGCTAHIARYGFAALVGGVAVVYAIGFFVQSALFHAPFLTVAAASGAFILGDIVKAAVAALAASGLARLR